VELEDDGRRAQSKLNYLASLNKSGEAYDGMYEAHSFRDANDYYRDAKDYFYGHRHAEDLGLPEERSVAQRLEM